MNSARSACPSRRLPWKLTSVGAGALMALVGCGGGGGNPETASSPPSAAQITGVVLDGPIEGARVFLDLNNNQAHDSGEPISPPTTAEGAFTLVTERLTHAQAATAMLVAHVPDFARDADDGGLDLLAAGRRGFTLMSPASAYIQMTRSSENVVSNPLLSPLTTLVAAEMALNGLALADAKASVQQRLALQGKDPMENFAATQDRTLANLARTVAIVLGHFDSLLADSTRPAGGQSGRDRFSATVEALKAQLPDLLANGDYSGRTTVPVADVVARLPTSTHAPASSSEPKPLRRFVVLFKEGVGDPASQAQELILGRGGQINFTYTTVVKGFAVALPEAASEAFLEATARSPHVDRVEVDQPVSLQQTTQAGATWGLDRSDQRALPLNTTFTYSTIGRGVRAYVVDTGILAEHADFGGRVTTGYTAVNDGYGTTDCNGHGTHVAGTISAATWGVAKGATLVPVRVLDCAGSGYLSGVIAGLDWVVANAQRPAVVNLSLGAGASPMLDAAVANTVAKGIAVVVAAGNAAADACNYSPAREPSALTVGSTTSSDARAAYSNLGTCLDLFAPGSSIRSTWYTSTTATNTISGTSMASPHVAGLVAQRMQSTPGATPAQLADAIKAAATTGKVTDAGSGSPNLLIYSGSTSPSEPPPPAIIEGAVSALTGSSVQIPNGWQATVSITVKDAYAVEVPGAVVRGGFTAGGSLVSCTTGISGACSIKSGDLSRMTLQTTFSVTVIAGAGLIYDASRNVATSSVVNRP